MSLSSPWPPRITSLPSRPSAESDPALVQITSARVVPVRSSSAAVPLIVQSFAAPATLPITPCTNAGPTISPTVATETNKLRNLTPSLLSLPPDGDAVEESTACAGLMQSIRTVTSCRSPWPSRPNRPQVWSWWEVAHSGRQDPATFLARCVVLSCPHPMPCYYLSAHEPVWRSRSEGRTRPPPRRPQRPLPPTRAMWVRASLQGRVPGAPDRARTRQAPR